jgi:hypothetical protein
MRFHCAICGRQRRVDPDVVFDREMIPIMTTPIATAIELASPAPATPRARPVPQPAIRTGARSILIITVTA